MSNDIHTHSHSLEHWKQEAEKNKECFLQACQTLSLIGEALLIPEDDTTGEPAELLDAISGLHEKIRDLEARARLSASHSDLHPIDNPTEKLIDQLNAAIRRIAAHVGACCGGVDTESELNETGKPYGPGGHTAYEIIRKIDERCAALSAQGEPVGQVVTNPFGDGNKDICALQWISDYRPKLGDKLFTYPPSAHAIAEQMREQCEQASVDFWRMTPGEFKAKYGSFHLQSAIRALPLPAAPVTEPAAQTVEALERVREWCKTANSKSTKWDLHEIISLCHAIVNLTLDYTFPTKAVPAENFPCSMCRGVGSHGEPPMTCNSCHGTGKDKLTAALAALRSEPAEREE